jgi:xanthine dehydrogenase molybdopterin-binding subunit B
VVALVVGRSLRACRAAAAAGGGRNTSRCRPLIGIREAIAAGSFHTPPHTLARGDAAAALARRRSGSTASFRFGGQEHFYLETQAAWAEAGEGGSVFVSSSTQHPTEIQAIVARCSAAAEQGRRPVAQDGRRLRGQGDPGQRVCGDGRAGLDQDRAARRIQLDRDVDMMITASGIPFIRKFSVGYDAEGMILAAEVDLFSDGGWSLDLSQPVLDRALFHLDNAYYIPAVRFTGLIAKTNVASNTAFRGFGGPQGMLVMEEIVDRVARRLGLPPEVVRGRNLYRGSGETNTTHFLQEIGDNRLQTVWNRSRRGGLRREAARGRRAWNRAHPG